MPPCKGLSLSTLGKGKEHREELYKVLLASPATFDPAAVASLLFAGNKTLHRHAEQAAYSVLEVDVAIPGYATVPSSSAITRRRKLDSVFRNPRLGKHVRSLTFRHASTPQTLIAMDKEGREGQRQDVWDLAVGLIELCPDVEQLRWETGLGVSGALWKAIASLDKVRKLAFAIPPTHPCPHPAQGLPPRITPSPQLLLPPTLDYLYSTSPTGSQEAARKENRLKAVGQGGFSLGKAWEDLEVLELANLGQSGAKTLTTHLRMLSDHPTSLISLNLSTPFFDMGLMSAISRIGAFGTLRHLEFATTGTKLTAEGLKEAVEGCRGLQSLTLHDVEGRLDKNTWRIIDDWPETLTSINIRIGESSNHHSWVLYHLTSIHHLPIGQLTRLAIRRLVHPTAELPFPPSGVAIPGIQGGHTAETIPSDLFEAILEQGGRLEELCLDWWMMEMAHLEHLLKAIPLVRDLRLGVRSSIPKVTSMTTLFGSVPHLEDLAIISPAEFSGTTGPFKPCCTPEELAILPGHLASRLEGGDQSLPEVRDLRKFARRLPRLRTIAWTGRDGKGTWHFSKKSPTALLVNVTFTHAAVSMMDVWNQCQDQAPSFDFDDTPSGMVLELPPPPVSATQADFPSLTRTTTGNSSRTTLQTPSSPTAPKRDLRRMSLPSASAPTTDMRALKLSLDDTAAKARKAAPVKSKAKTIKVPSSPQTPTTPQTPSFSSQDVAKRMTFDERDKTKPTKSYAGILENITRYVPGSGRLAASIEKPKPVSKKSVVDPVTIVEDDEDAFEHYSDFERADMGWTTVVKEKPKEKVKVVATQSDAKSRRKERKAKK